MAARRQMAGNKRRSEHNLLTHPEG